MIVVLLITAFLAISGIKPSTKYAIIAGSVEIAVLLLVGFTLMYLVHFKLSNPFMGGVSLSNLGLAVIYASCNTNWVRRHHSIIRRSKES